LISCGLPELPEGWTVAVLSSLCDRQRGVSYGRDDARSEPADGLIPILRANNIDGDRLNFNDLVYVPCARVSENQQLRPGDVVIAMSSGSKSVVGKTAQILDEWDGSFGAFCGVLRPHSEMDARYFGLFLRTREYRQAISELSAGTNINNLKAEHFDAIQVPIAPLAEQRRIVGKLELLLGKVSSSQQRLSRVPGLLKRFRQSVLAAACSGKLTADWREENSDIEPASTLRVRIQSQLGRPLSANEWEEQPLDVPPSWEWLQAEDLCRKSGTITYGVLKPVWVTKGVPTVRVQDMKAGMIEVEAVGRCSPERAAKFSKTSLEAGDLLIAKDGATLGKTAFVPPSLAGGNVTQHVLRFPITSCVFPVFVRLVIDSRHGQEWMRSETKGVALPGVNVGDFRRMPIPLPPLSEQQEIVRRVEKLFAFADQIESRLRQAQAHVDRLTQSLLAKAFRGGLVPTEAELAGKEGRDYETAENLLKRIRATSQEDSTKPGKRKKGQVRDA
jgi:type I restriction enzyme S subunit